ncbi:hypothetical protein F383_35386 [Gossypium arboreum]|uniref:Uncharacterized protein n=1 Tax=Gossypium arboreum TaxID=29729 RepID=A0A0B0N829_GOSAR|nr:hypothetical protein F383_37573 [Gossypium arboreum]KHG08014.1 hypothetical protein F383_35386 [Gossypium arboreum]
MRYLRKYRQSFDIRKSRTNLRNRSDMCYRVRPRLERWH